MRPHDKVLKSVLLTTWLSLPLAGQSTASSMLRGVVDLEIGSGADASAVSFGRVSGLAVDRLGRVFVADAQDNLIRVFTPSGRVAGTIGRVGSGPLEFKRVAAIGFGDGGMLWARDEGNVRMHVVEVSGVEFREVKTVPMANYSSGSRVPIVVLADGTLVDEGFIFDATLASMRPTRVLRSPSGIIRKTDTLPVPEGAFAGVVRMVEEARDGNGKVGGGTSVRTYSQPFGPRWLRAYSARGLRADAVSSSYLIRIFDGDERLRATIRRTAIGVAASASEREQAAMPFRERNIKMPFEIPKLKAPIVAISPLVAGKPIKGPADRLLSGLGIDVSAAGVAGLYRDFLDTFIIDTQDLQQQARLEEFGVSVIVTDTIMSDMEKSVALAQVVMKYEHEKRKTKR